MTQRWIASPDGGGEPVRRGAAHRGGFTVTELLVVLMVVSIMSLLLAPNLEMVRFRMDGAARGSMAAMMAAQRLAVKRQHDVAVVFDTANRRLLIHEDHNNNGAVDAGEPARVIPFDDGVEFGLGAAPPLMGESLPISFTELQGTLPVVRFIRNGSASADGGFYLTSSRSTRGPEYSRDSRAVRVDRGTGRVTWYEYKGSEWVQQF